MAIALYDKTRNQRLFEITPAERDQLVAALEEESSQDHDYWIDSDVLDFLDGKVDAALIGRLRPLVGAVAPAEGEVDRDDDSPIETSEAPGGIEIEWRTE